MKKIITVIIVLVLLAGCSTRLIDFTIISSKNVDLSRAAEFTKGSERIEGIDQIHIIIFIPTGVPNMKEALDKAIEKVPGAVALLDGVITYKWFYIPYIYGNQKYVVEGSALIDPTLISQQDSKIGQYNVAYLDKQGDLESFDEVTEEEYNRFKKK